MVRNVCVLFFKSPVHRVVVAVLLVTLLCRTNNGITSLFCTTVHIMQKHLSKNVQLYILDNRMVALWCKR